MSSIGFYSLPAGALASTLAGSPQTRPSQNSASADAARQDFQATLQALSAKTTGDVDSAQLSSERDADGRNLAGYDESPPQETSESVPDSGEEQTPRTVRAADPDSLLGRLLDLDA